MSETDTDTAWQQWGERDPYFGVISLEKFRSQNLTDEAKREFFEYGRQTVHHVLAVCRRRFDQDFSPKRALDFGCGVGRVVIPLAGIAEQVVGLDVSDAMLKEAEKNCKEHSVNNVSLLKSDDLLSPLDGRFDLIHSLVVFQHLAPDRGLRLFARLLDRLEEGGVCAVQFTYAMAVFRASHGVPPAGSLMTKVGGGVRRRVGIWREVVARLIRRMIGTGPVPRDPDVQMNLYNVNELLFTVQSAGIDNTYVEFTDHGGYLGVYLYFQKPKKG
jgi:SAM-dependent methyltransferase